MIRTTIAAATLALTAGQAAAEIHAPNIYAYKTHENYCPAGLQPVTINGVICCGQPNQSITYQQAMTHPVARRHVPKRHAAQAAIPLKGTDTYSPGTKGID